MYGLLAHIIDAPVAQPVAVWSIVLAAVASAFAAWLVVEHHVVKHGRVVVPSRRSLTRAAVAIAALGLVATLSPSAATGQDVDIPVGLPDLVSEPPIIWFDKIVEYDDGTIAKVMAFDGYLHNAGDGMLDLYGNPQEPGGMQQRYFDGEDWVPVGAPLVLYETTDGHNHFHLMTAAEYELWNEARTEKIGDSAKVGFCLVDTEQLSVRMDAFYDIDTYNYCERENPEATELRMGISPGWVDTYDANTTLQWVDVSNTRPGRYWVAAIMDPENRIVESNEDNNGHVWSTGSFAVSGWVARELPMQAAGEAIALKADGYGVTGPRSWTIVEGPTNGVLSVPTGVDFFTDEITYRPVEGFDGVDSFVLAAGDVDSPYPLEPVTVTIEVDASGYDGPAVDASGEAAPVADESLVISGLDEPLDAAMYSRIERQADLSPEGDSAEGPIDWFATGLPSGVVIDRDSGVISGVPTVHGEGEASIMVVADGRRAEASLPWTVIMPTIGDRPTLEDVGDKTAPRHTRVNMYLGLGADGAVYSATGLPEGVRMVENIPLITGDPSEAGVFDVEIIETIDGEVTDSVSFTWTIRPVPYPEFPN